MIRRFVPLMVAVALLGTGCSSDESNDILPLPTLATISTAEITTTTLGRVTTTTVVVDDGFPVTIEAPNGVVTIDSRPDRVVSISPTSTEVLFAIGAGDQVVAVDSMSNFPVGVPITDLSAFTPSVEAIATYEPDLVFLSFDPGDIVAGLEAVGIPVILHGTAATVDEAYTQWEQTGAATGHLAEAVAVVSDTAKNMSSAVDALQTGSGDITYYYELDPTFYSVTSASFIGELLEPTGMGNIADAGDPDGFGYPQLSAEYIIDANPTLILLADTICCGATAEKVGQRPGWGTLTAVTSGSVVGLDDDIASRWGPRIADLFEDVVVAILQLEMSDA